MVGHFGQASAKQGLHYDYRDAATVKLVVEIFGIGVAWIYLLGMLPVDIVELNLHEIPFVSVVFGQQAVKHCDVAVIGESEIAYPSGFAFGHEVVEHAVVDVTVLKRLHGVITHAYAVEEHVVDVIGLKFLERIVIHCQ